MKRIFSHAKQQQSIFCKSCQTTKFLTNSFQQQTAKKHFVIIQWPNNEVSLKIDNRKTAQEHDEFFHDISQYAESQIQRLHNLKPKPKKSSPLEYNHQPSRQLDALLSHKTTSHTAPCTYSVQLNSVTMIDPIYFQSNESSTTPATTTATTATANTMTTTSLEQKKKRVRKVASSKQQKTEDKNVVDKKNENFVMEAFQNELKQRYQAALQQQEAEQEQKLKKTESKAQEQMAKTTTQQESKQEQDEDDDDLTKDQQALATEESTATATVEQA